MREWSFSEEITDEEMFVELNDEQRRAIEDSQWIVNDVLKHYGKSYDNDLRQSALLYMCKCVMRYEPQKGKWETYAYANTGYFVWKQIKRQNAEKERTAKEAAEDMVNTESEDIDGTITAKSLVEKLKANSTDRERIVIDLLLAGHKKSEVARKIGKAPQTISGIVESLRRKIKEQTWS